MIKKKSRDIIESEAERYSSSFYDRAYASEKNEYDDEVKLPKCNKLKIQTKKMYSVDNSKPKNEKRRKNRLSELEKRLLKPDKSKEDEKYINDYINKQYSYSLTEFSDMCADNNVKDGKTIRSRFNALLKIIGCDRIERVPKLVFDELCEIINSFDKGKHTLNRCAESPTNILEDLNNSEKKNVYKFYIIIKQILLIESNDKTDYDNKISELRNDDSIKQTYKIAKVMMNLI